VLLGARNACRTEQMSFEIGFVGVDRSKMRREGVPNRGAIVCRKPREQSWHEVGREDLRRRSEADVLGCRCVAKMTNIEGKRYGEKGSQFIINSLPNRKPMKRI